MSADLGSGGDPFLVDSGLCYVFSCGRGDKRGAVLNPFYKNPNPVFKTQSPPKGPTS